ncbi:anthranilate phosphoribosyltransferase [Alkaliphilus peptidifermentans]|uniref:Anthranilate phosphoribosyltransferase n=1 Tax=Alkaliphilus peptidifermentans DSM 18978 TaxID=1120976 RepID=A0A1G5JRM3_9FIRM|nr:anthranilate phosphoribosyltransferase [Alkaliphilus peptidifermentans]SCY90388.1 anthranilate phosphoribosyltransferase [Alkaliphilus peptidifermentans DSM 18978]
MFIEKAIKKLSVKENLSDECAYGAMNEIMEGIATPVEIAAFLTALRLKGETTEEIYSCSRVLREKCLRVKCREENIVDTCGTGGDGGNTFNISTAAMFIAAGAGVKVAKHGNRSITSKSGAADVLEGLGAEIYTPPEVVERCIEEVGVGFMFAPMYHSSMKHAMSVRRELGFRTIFNVLGPLTNPAASKRQLLGVFDKNLVLKMAEVLNRLGTKHAMVVHGFDGLDEITLTGNTYVAEVMDGDITEYTIKPEDFGLTPCLPYDIKGGGPEENARIIKGILSGEEGAKADIAKLNAGAAIYVGGGAKSLKEGIEKAKESVKERRALAVLNNFIEKTKVV